ncbi:MAG: hypothetical protein PHV32_06695 [Eubacteriales bacterium]|nr:hypothetical protein [Eubacteriales bacterium]
MKVLKTRQKRTGKQYVSFYIFPRFDNPVFDVRNGTAFWKIADVPVVKGDKYHIELAADMNAKTYSVWVTPPGGARTQIAENYSFRTTADHTDGVAKVYLTSAYENDSMKMENLVITEWN